MTDMYQNDMMKPNTLYAIRKIISKFKEKYKSLYIVAYATYL